MPGLIFSSDDFFLGLVRRSRYCGADGTTYFVFLGLTQSVMK